MFLVTMVVLSLVFFSLADIPNVQIIDVPFYSMGPDIPHNLTALVGDILVFSIVDTSQHTFAQTSPNYPCVVLPDGFSTGAGARGYADFAIQMLDRNAPVYYACMHHYHYGEVGTINAPLDPSDSGSLAVFVLAAKGSNTTDFTTAANLSAPGTYANGTVLVTTWLSPRPSYHHRHPRTRVHPRTRLAQHHRLRQLIGRSRSTNTRDNDKSRTLQNDVGNPAAPTDTYRPPSRRAPRIEDYFFLPNKPRLPSRSGPGSAARCLVLRPASFTRRPTRACARLPFPLRLAQRRAPSLDCRRWTQTLRSGRTRKFARDSRATLAPLS